MKNLHRVILCNKTQVRISKNELVKLGIGEPSLNNNS